ncbi:HTH_Tnp_Tc3_2 domain-containing protein [Trichonephila clavipes]|nr:HTH_Tnp_Tc3_2 domain-containing protein [Trichonephila clavipes]
MTLTAVTNGTNPGYVCKCIEPVRHGRTLNIRRAQRPLEKFFVNEDRWKIIEPPWGGGFCSKLSRNGVKSCCHLHCSQSSSQTTYSTRHVASQVDRSECAVRNYWEQWTREGTHAWKTGSGATRKTTRREDRRNVRQALAVHTVTRSTMRADVGVAIVPQTISRHLAEANLKSKRPFRALPLTPEHWQQRL